MILRRLAMAFFSLRGRRHLVDEHTVDAVGRMRSFFSYGSTWMSLAAF